MSPARMNRPYFRTAALDRYAQPTGCPLAAPAHPEPSRHPATWPSQDRLVSLSSRLEFYSGMRVQGPSGAFALLPLHLLHPVHAPSRKPKKTGSRHPEKIPFLSPSCHDSLGNSKATTFKINNLNIPSRRLSSNATHTSTFGRTLKIYVLLPFPLTFCFGR